MKYSIALVIILITLLFFSPFFFSAKASYTCDLCGFCEGGEKPADWDSCVDCMYGGNPLNAPVSGKQWTVIGCVETSPSGFTRTILTFVVSVAGGIMFITILYGSFTVLTSAGDVVKLSRGKTMIRSGIFALILIIFSIFILRFIGVTILKLPGFE